MYISIGKGVYIGYNSLLGEPPNDSSLDGIEHLFNYSAREFSNSYRPLIIRDNAIIRDYVSIDLGIRRPTVIGRGCYIHSRASIHHDVKLADACIVGPNVCLCGSVSVDYNAQLGASSTVHQGLTIGAYSMVGMGAAVVSSIPPFLLVYGIPARPKKINYKKILPYFSKPEIDYHLNGYFDACLSGSVAHFFLEKQLPSFFRDPISNYIWADSV